MRHVLATLALGPLLLYQGRRVRLNTPKLPEPPGDRTGEQGDGKKLRLLVLGDSAAAGVGASHQREALSGKLIANLCNDYTLSWELLAKTGATTKSTLQVLDSLDDTRFDIVVISLGVNDVTGGVALTPWLEQQQLLRFKCFDKLEAKLIISSGLPPLSSFPALPQPLRWYLGRRASQFDFALEKAIRNEPDSRFLSLRFSTDPDLMAADGFHPGPKMYEEWAWRTAQIVRSAFPG